jgi:hypothetical protein
MPLALASNGSALFAWNLAPDKCSCSWRKRQRRVEAEEDE